MLIFNFKTVLPLVRGLQNHNLTVIEGSTESLQFVIHNANPPVQTFEISWLFGNEIRLDLFPNGTVFRGTTLVFSEDYLSLVLINITYNISGRITMRANNAAGQSQDYVNIDVHGKYILCYLNMYIYVCMYICTYICMQF